MIHLRNPDASTIRRVVIDLLSGVRNRSLLADELGVHRTTLYKWESGESRPSLPMLSQLCCALGQQIRIDLGPEIKEDSTLTILHRIEEKVS